MKTEMITPFSCGTEAMDWICNNCDQCVKSYRPKDGIYPSDKTMKEYIRIGKECQMKYDLDFGFIIGEIPLETAQKIGYNNDSLSSSCMMFSDDSNDGYKAPRRPKPDNTPGNQMVMPFIIEGIISKKELV